MRHTPCTKRAARWASVKPHTAPRIIDARHLAASRREARGGYTLLELVLVLTVIVLLASIAWPRLEGVLQRNRLRRSAEQVRAHLAAARMRAIDSGLIYQFRYEPGGRRFAALPAEAAFASSEPAEQGSPTSLEEELEEDIRFELPPDELARASAGAAALPVPASSGSGSDSGNWSPPILFLPDGTSLDATILLADSEERTIRVSVRGLTGGVRVGDVVGRSEQ